MLLSPDTLTRHQVEEYLISKLLKRDKASVSNFLHQIRTHQNDRDPTPSHRRIWALLVVGRYARALSISVDPLKGEPSGVMTMEEVRQACLSGDDDIRLAALQFMVTDSRSTNIPQPAEMNLLLEVRTSRTSRSDHPRRWPLPI